MTAWLRNLRWRDTSSPELAGSTTMHGIRARGIYVLKRACLRDDVRLGSVPSQILGATVAGAMVVCCQSSGGVQSMAGG